MIAFSRSLIGLLRGTEKQITVQEIKTSVDRNTGSMLYMSPEWGMIQEKSDVCGYSTSAPMLKPWELTASIYGKFCTGIEQALLSSIGINNSSSPRKPKTNDKSAA